MKFNIIRILLITCLLSSQVGIWAQTKSITGTVCDTNGEMIIGANVTVKGTTKGTITNVYGIYTVSATPKDIIEISFIGYKSVQKKVGNRGIINVVLEEDSKMLDDVVVVGVLDEIRQSRRRVGQRVGAVADDEAVIEGIILLHGLRHHQPVLRAEVGAVDAAQGQCVGAAELVQLRQMSQKLFAGEHGLEALLGADAGDGAAGGDKKQTLLCGHRKSLHQED